MIEAILVVLTKAYPGREDDMNDWYTNIHIRDALRFRGSIAAQRFKLSAVQAQSLGSEFGWQYLALYDAFDAALFSKEHWDAATTTRMMITTAIDSSILNDYHYYPLQFRNNDPEVAHTGGVVLEQLNAAPGKEAEFRDWYNAEYLPQAVKRPGVHSAGFLMFREYGQMVPGLPPHRYVGIYRTQEANAVAPWREDALLRGSKLVDQASLLVTNWDAVTPRITEDQVHHTSAAALAEEERARARMGNDVERGGKEKLALD